MHVAEFLSRQLISGKVSDRRVIKAVYRRTNIRCCFFFYLFKHRPMLKEQTIKGCSLSEKVGAFLGRRAEAAAAM
jgi:hypothetical protein